MRPSGAASPAFSAQPAVDGAVLGPEALVLRFPGPEGRDRLLLVNLGGELALGSVAEPLLAPPSGARWTRIWSSDDPRYGGSGDAPFDERDWRLQAASASVLAPAPR